MTASESEPKPGAIKRAAGAVAGHAKARRQFQAPNWMIYVILAVGLCGVIYGVVQQFRVVRLDKLRKASEIRIAELEADKKAAYLKAAKDITEGRLKVNKKKLKKINTELKTIEKEREALERKTDRMSPVDLKKAFRREK